ncbi:hypothetical protein [Treponema pectinovorum]|uniref:hypothetical protein n=1 Tax=Treponema pectinovorum TaxID=164 RepID=UPI0011C6FDC8|nr:hypothetical protein [Treponema pectinovorum]
MVWIISVLIFYFIVKKVMKVIKELPPTQFELTSNETLLTYNQWYAIKYEQPVPPRKRGEPLINKEEFERQDFVPPVIILS